MTIKKMTPKQIEIIRDELEEILTEPLKNLGLKFEMGNGVYDADSVKFNNFRISLLDALTKDEKLLKQELDYRNQSSYSLSLDGEKIFNHGNKAFKLCGYKPRASKRPFIVADLNSKQEYVISEREAERMFGIEGSKDIGDLNYTPKVIG